MRVCGLDCEVGCSEVAELYASDKLWQYTNSHVILSVGEKARDRERNKLIDS